MIGRHVDDHFRFDQNLRVDVTTAKESEASTRDGIHYADFNNPQDLEKIITDGKYQAILNFAGIADPRIARNHPEMTEQINRKAVTQMLETITKLPSEKRPIVILACSALQFDIRESGLVSAHHPLKENGDPYVASKNGMFWDAQEYLDRIDIRFAFIANTTGQGHALGYFPTDMADQLIKGEQIINHGHVDHKRPFLHARDAAKIFYYGLTKMQSGDRFLVASEVSTKLENFLETMIQVSGRSGVSHQIDPNFGSPTSIKDVNFDIQNLLSMGYRREYGIADICRTLLNDRLRVLQGGKLPVRGISR